MGEKDRGGAVKRMLLAEQWDQYCRTVLPKNVSTVQRWETRRAFYAGAQAILFRVISAFAPESEPTDNDLLVMEGVQQELQDFARSVEQERA